MPTDPARDRAAEAAHYLLACDNVRAAAVEYLFAVTGPVELDQVDEVVDALLAAPNLLSALAGVPHPGVEELAEVIDPPAFDPRRLDVGTAYERGQRQRAALDAAGRVRALLGHTPTATLDSGSIVAPDNAQEG